MGREFDRLWQKAGEQRVPITGAFELLPLCNLACKMCYVRKEPLEVKEAGGLKPLEFWLDTARQARDAGLLLPLITGGEPFLYPDFQKLFAEMQQMGLQVSINSNAAMIDESMAAWLGKHRPTRINITLYGASEQTYERLCGNGDAYNRVCRAVEWLKKYGVPVKFNTSITEYNYDDLEAIIAYAKSVGSPVQVATYMFPPVRRDNRMIGQNDRMSPQQAAAAKVRADWLQQEPAWFKKQAERYSQFVPLTDEMIQKQTSLPAREMKCRAGRCSFWVDWQGNLSACGMGTFFSVKLSDSSFTEAWGKIAQCVSDFRYASVCTNCPNNHLCHACAAMVINETGTADGKPEYLCEMGHYIAKYYQEYAGNVPELSEHETKCFRIKEDNICEI